MSKLLQKLKHLNAISLLNSGLFYRIGLAFTLLLPMWLAVIVIV